MVRNLKQINGLPRCPTRFWRNMIGPAEAILIATLIIRSTAIRTGSAIKMQLKSRMRFHGGSGLRTEEGAAADSNSGSSCCWFIADCVTGGDHCEEFSLSSPQKEERVGERRDVFI